MGEMGLLGMQIPEAYGGAGMKFHDYVIALEEVAHADASIGLTMASHNSLCTGHIYLAANEAQKQKYLPRLASGKALGALGPDRARLGLGRGRGAHARRAQGRDRWVINGTKTFITQGSVGEIYVILASTSPEKKAKGLTAFIVERGTPGFRTGKRIEKMGLHASDTTELVLEEVEVADEQRLGDIDQGFFDTLKILDKGRIGIGAWSIGIGRAAFEAARRYAKERVQFDKPIAEFQAIQHMLADMATELDAARLLVWRAALDAGPGAAHDRASRRSPSTTPRAPPCAPATPPCRSTAATATRASSTSSATCATPSWPRSARGPTRSRRWSSRASCCGRRQRAASSGSRWSGAARSTIARLRAGDLGAAAAADARARRRPARRAGGAAGDLPPRRARRSSSASRARPGVGKSTLVDALIGASRARGERVAVVAVDPVQPVLGRRAAGRSGAHAAPRHSTTACSSARSRRAGSRAGCRARRPRRWRCSTRPASR